MADKSIIVFRHDKSSNRGDKFHEIEQKKMKFIGTIV